MKTATAAAVGLGVLIGPVIGGLALEDVCTWDNTSGGNWNVPANWSPAEVPDIADEAATIPDDGFSYTIELDIDPWIAWLAMDNPDATLNLNDRTLTLDDAHASINGGVIAANSGNAALNGDLEIIPGGEIRVATGQRLEWGDHPDIVNDGTILINTDGTAGDTWILFSNDAEVTGAGEIVLNGDNDRAQIITDNLVSMTHGEDHLIHGYGNIRAAMFNEGRIIADAGTVIRIHPGSLSGGPDEVTFTNAPGGVIKAQGADVTIRYSNKFRNEGLVEAVAGQKVSALEGDYVQTTGVTRIDGEMEISDGIFDLQAGSLRGDGLVTGDIQVNGGTVFPGDIFDAGVLDVTGNFEIFGSGFFVDLASDTDYDQLNATGDVVVAGSLYIYAIEQYIPPEDQQFVIITGNTVSGEFDTVWASGEYDIAYNPQDVTVTVITPPRPTDINGDGWVNVLDFLDLLAHWGPCPEPCPPCYADINNDCTVNVVDFLALLANWD